jgi:adenosylcobyric acid synthase
VGGLLMVQGTSSDAGKSVICAALCRWLREEGYTVAPFKAQNMALNAMAVPGGGEIGWAQVMQAEAAQTEPLVQMNPVLLKPISDTVCQVVLEGRPIGHMSAAAYQEYKKTAFTVVLDCLQQLRHNFDVVVIEGAGSPAEVNLRDHDIVNMRLAAACGAPVLLAADIDCGGVFASVAGTMALLEEYERRLVRGIVINKFRGFKEKLQPGLEMLERITAVPVAGVLPYLEGLSLPAEDSLGLRGGGSGSLEVAVIALPRISNFTDYHVLTAGEGVMLRYVRRAEEVGSPHLVILPGTKDTLGDLSYLRQSGLDKAITAARRRGTAIVGICGGFQLLGRRISDASACDGRGGVGYGLGLLEVETMFSGEKRTARVKGYTLEHGEELEGYEIHMGHSTLLAGRPFAMLQEGSGRRYTEGAVSDDGQVFGTYLHGLFDGVSFRRGFFNRLRQKNGLPKLNTAAESAGERREASYRLLAQAVREHLDTGLLARLLVGR